MVTLESLTKWIGAGSATVALVAGGFTITEKVNIFKDRTVVIWHPEHFDVTDAAAEGEFKVIVAREKLRDDCSVEKFNVEVKDSDLIMHKAIPSISNFSGPVNNKIDKFAFKIRIEDPKETARGEATLLAQIHYKCPEGMVVVDYPDHPNLKFKIL